MTWPLVTKADTRESAPHRCFYCQSLVGADHAQECVAVTKIVQFKVMREGRLVAYWRRDMPYDWDSHMCEFHLNDSSWCANNFLDEEGKGSTEWITMPQWDELRALVKSGPCFCSLYWRASETSEWRSLLEFEFDKVVDETPKVRS